MSKMVIVHSGGNTYVGEVEECRLTDGMEALEEGTLRLENVWELHIIRQQDERGNIGQGQIALPIDGARGAIPTVVFQGSRAAYFAPPEMQSHLEEVIQQVRMSLSGITPAGPGDIPPPTSDNGGVGGLGLAH